MDPSCDIVVGAAAVIALRETIKQGLMGIAFVILVVGVLRILFK